MRNLLVLLSFCFVVTNLFAQTPDPAKLKSEGDNALKAKNYAVAFTKYNQYLKQTNYQDSITAFNCGVCADRTKKYADAAKLFDVAIKKNYNVASAYIGKASALRNLNKDSEYLATLQEAMQAAPANATIEKLYAIYYLKEGQAFQKAGNLAKAEESYKHATEVTSKKWKTDALYSLGVLFFNNGAVTLKKAAPLANSDAAKYEAEKKSANDDFQKASTYLEEAVALSPERAEVAKVLGQVKAAM